MLSKTRGFVREPASNGWSEAGMPMKWIARRNIKVDRVACPWLIRRYVDAATVFMFVAEEDLLATARKENAIPCAAECGLWSAPVSSFQFRLSGF